MGILDLDLYAPDIPAMLGIAHTKWTHVWTLARTTGAHTRESPVEHDGLFVASTGFLLGEDQPMGLEAQTLELLARHLIQWVRWPAIDFLVVDLPAGTSAVQHVLARLLKVDGALRLSSLRSRDRAVRTGGAVADDLGSRRSLVSWLRGWAPLDVIGHVDDRGVPPPEKTELEPQRVEV